MCLSVSVTLTDSYAIKEQIHSLQKWKTAQFVNQQNNGAVGVKSPLRESSKRTK